jgi:hypothetical protein
LRFYGLRIKHRWTEWNMKGAHVVWRDNFGFYLDSK